MTDSEETVAAGPPRGDPVSMHPLQVAERLWPQKPRGARPARWSCPAEGTSRKRPRSCFTDRKTKATPTHPARERPGERALGSPGRALGRGRGARGPCGSGHAHSWVWTSANTDPRPGLRNGSCGPGTVLLPSGNTQITIPLACEPSGLRNTCVSLNFRWRTLS